MYSSPHSSQLFSLPMLLSSRLSRRIAVALFPVLLCSLTNHSLAAPATRANIRSAVLSKGYNGKPVNVTQTFAPPDRTIHATVKLDRVSNGDRVKVIWFVLDAGGLRNYRLTDKTQTTQRMNQIHFATTAPRQWPRGRYRADFYINGQRQNVLTFAVQ
jgi:hypothetical protein